DLAHPGSHPLSDGFDQADLFGHGYKDGWWDIAFVWMAPPEQRFKRHDVTLAQIDDGLQKYLQLVLIDGPTQVHFKLHALAYADVHCLVEYLVIAASGGFGAVECDVGIAKYFFGRFMIFGNDDYAHAHADF